MHSAIEHNTKNVYSTRFHPERWWKVDICGPFKLLSAMWYNRENMKQEFKQFARGRGSSRAKTVGTRVALEKRGNFRPACSHPLSISEGEGRLQWNNYNRVMKT